MRRISKNIAFWVYKNRIIELDVETHIQYIIKNPEMFNTTKKEIDNIYKGYNEPVNLEGKAREEIIKNIAKKGWIRIRYYSGHGGEYWSIQCDNYRRREKAIFDFIDYAIDNNIMAFHDPVSIISYDVGGVSLSYSFGEGGISKLYENRKKKGSKKCE